MVGFEVPLLVEVLSVEPTLLLSGAMLSVEAKYSGHAPSIDFLASFPNPSSQSVQLP